MKKGIIIDHQGENTVVLTKDGRFLVTKKSDGELGEDICSGITMKSLITLVLLTVVTFMMTGVGIYTVLKVNNTAVTYVSVDINPSVEFTLNAGGKVLSSRALNEDGKILSAGVSFCGMDIRNAVNTMIGAAAEAGYFEFFDSIETIKSDGISLNMNAVMITVVNDDDGNVQNIKHQLTESVKNYFENNDIFSLILTQDGNYNYRADALTSGMSIGKLHLTKLVEGSIDSETAKDMSVKDLVSVIANQQKEQNRDNYSAYRVKRQNLFDSYGIRYEEYRKQMSEQPGLYKQIEAFYNLHCTSAIEKMSMDWEAYKSQWVPPCEII